MQHTAISKQSMHIMPDIMVRTLIDLFSFLKCEHWSTCFIRSTCCIISCALSPCPTLTQAALCFSYVPDHAVGIIVLALRHM